MPPIVVFDVALLAISSQASTSAEAEENFEAINAWATVAERQNCCRVAISSDAVEVLQAANCFPATHQIQALLELFNLKHVFSARDINARIFSLLGRTEKLVDVFGREAVQTANERSKDVDLSQSPDPAITRSTLATLATTLLSEDRGLVRVVLGFPSVRSPIRYVSDVVVVDTLDIGRQAVSPAQHVEGLICVVRSPSEFLHSLDGWLFGVALKLL
jgi:hypothetical protein